MNETCQCGDVCVRFRPSMHVMCMITLKGASKDSQL